MTQQPLTCVQTHPCPHDFASGVGVAQETSLSLSDGQHRTGRGREDGEESIALGLHLDAASGGDCLSEDPMMGGQEIAVRVAHTLDEPSRSFDIGEQERHRPSRQLRHLGTLPES
jgi:hypothetical protein